MLRSRSGPHRIHLLIGHTHWDHIQGFPFFTPAFLPGTELNIYGSAGFQRSLEDSLSGQMQYSYFPVKLTDLSSRIHYTELEEGFFRIGEVYIETQYLNHTAPTVGFRIMSGGASIAYITDHEPFWNSPGPVFHHPGDQRHIEFLKNCDLLVHDAQYTNEEYRTKLGWGHSPIDYVVDIALAAGVSRLALYHHDPLHDDDAIRRFEEEARLRVAASGSSMQVFAAAEGMALKVTGRGLAPTVPEFSALDRRPISGGRVLMVTDKQADIAAIDSVLPDDGLVMMAVATGAVALDRARAVSPDLVIINSELPDGDGASFIQPLRAALGKPELPVLLLTDNHGGTESLYSAESIATDYLAKPFSPPMLRTRVHAWLARTIGTSGLQSDMPSPRAASVHAATAAAAGPPAAPSFVGNPAAVPLLSSLNQDQIHRLLAQSRECVYPPGETIIRQGENGDSVYLVLSGRVRIVEPVPDSPVEMFLGELGEGEIFGELGILRERPRSASVMTLERTVCMKIPEKDFVVALADSAEMSMKLLRILAGRLYDADRLLARYAPDPITGLPGRRAFHEMYRRLTAGIRRRRASVLLLALDVVNLREVNDRFGYNVGDEVLRTVADALLESSRTTDLVCRYGGDEFAALLVEAGNDDAEIIVNRVQQKLNALAVHRSLPLAVECVIGMTFSANPPETADELLRLADQDMQAKRFGQIR
jgi:diguanylate cyclase (GGDEF)-like protein